MHWQLAPIGLPSWPLLLLLLPPLPLLQLLLLALLQTRLVLLHKLLAQPRHLPLKHLNILYSLQRLQPILLVPQQHITLQQRHRHQAGRHTHLS
jgi:hypothetical protein